MRLRISSIADRGVPEKERIILNVLVSTDIGEYAIFRTGVEDGTVTIGVDSAYWFPDKTVSEGDKVILYTKAGTPSEKVLKSGSTAHFFYWGQSGKVFWKSEAYGAVVLHADEWISFIPNSD